jgi:hypothetical protein
MAEYIVKIYSGTKAANGKDLTIDKIVEQIEGLGGKIIDDSGAMMVLVSYSGSVKKLYTALGYEPKDLLITPLTKYKLPDEREKIK